MPLLPSIWCQVNWSGVCLWDGPKGAKAEKFSCPAICFLPLHSSVDQCKSHGPYLALNTKYMTQNRFSSPVHFHSCSQSVTYRVLLGFSTVKLWYTSRHESAVSPQLQYFSHICDNVHLNVLFWACISVGTVDWMRRANASALSYNINPYKVEIYNIILSCDRK